MQHTFKRIYARQARKAYTHAAATNYVNMAAEKPDTTRTLMCMCAEICETKWQSWKNGKLLKPRGIVAVK